MMGVYYVSKIEYTCIVVGTKQYQPSHFQLIDVLRGG